MCPEQLTWKSFFVAQIYRRRNEAVVRNTLCVLSLEFGVEIDFPLARDLYLGDFRHYHPTESPKDEVQIGKRNLVRLTYCEMKDFGWSADRGWSRRERHL
jgi:hypothetical protein